MHNEPWFLGRQPVLDRDQNMVAFELLFRTGNHNTAKISDDFTATATVINHAFNEFGIEAALGPYQGFINMSESLLMSDVVELLPKDKVVLEILESVSITETLIERCKLLKEIGFQFALDDFTDYAAEFDPFLELVDIVKIDLLSVEPSKLAALVGKIRNWPVKLLAEKVETGEQFDHCLQLGFDLFQGYHFAKPHIITGKRLSHSELTLMKLLGQVMQDADEQEIEATIKENPVLSLNLMRLASSVAYGAKQKSTSIRSAITLLGRRQLQRWIQILLYSHAGRGNIANPLLQLAATRGKIMERLAADKHDEQFEDRAFMTGIMSLMDTLLSTPITEIISSLPISDDIKAALVARDGELGKLLSLVETLEKGDMGQIEEKLENFHYLTQQNLNDAHAGALTWANQIAIS